MNTQVSLKKVLCFLKKSLLKGEQKESNSARYTAVKRFLHQQTEGKNILFFRRRFPGLSLQSLLQMLREAGVEPLPAACSHAGIATGHCPVRYKKKKKISFRINLTPFLFLRISAVVFSTGCSSVQLQN
jgi:hypothetical protein